MYELIIIGGGPAGITAGIYAARKQIKTLVLSKNSMGQVGESGFIENWPGEKNISGPELMKKFQDHLNSHEIEIKEEEVISIEKNDFFLVKTQNNEFQAKSVIIATGRKPKKLNITGEKEFIGKGVSYCVTCDGAFFKNKTVAIVGGGNAGFEGAIELSNYAKEVFILENSANFQADKILQTRAREKGIKLLTEIKVEEIRGDVFVKEIDYRSEKKNTLKVDGVFINIGSKAVTDFLTEDLVDFSDQKEIKIDFETCQTKTLGLFAAGDVTTVRDKQIAVACGEAVKALISCYNFLQNF